MRVILAAAGALAWVWSGQAAPPVIYSVHPDSGEIFAGKHRGGFMTCTVRTITGAHFDVPGLQLWVWNPPGAPELVDQTAILDERADKEKARNESLLRIFRQSSADEAEAFEQELDDLLAPDRKKDDASAVTHLPAQPPTGDLLTAAKPLPDSEVERVTADTIQARVPPGQVLWIRNRDGWSKPYALDASQAFWVTPRRVEPGNRIALGGVAVGGSAVVALFRGDRVYSHQAGDGSRGGSWYGDPYLAICRVPPDVEPGRYRVLAHNGYGGRFGWCAAGEIEVVPRGALARPTVSLRDHGAVGDGTADDTGAWRAALAAAAAEAGDTGADLYAAPGIYRITETLEIPRAVRVRGAGPEQTVIAGAGGENISQGSLAPLLKLGSETHLLKLALRGAVSAPQTEEVAQPLVEIATEAEEVSVIGCQLGTGRGEAPGGPVESAGPYAVAIAGAECRDINLSRNAIFGKVDLRDCARLDLVYNRIAAANLKGGALAVTGAEALIDSNVIDAPSGGVLLHPLRRSVIHYNEQHFRVDDASRAPAEPPEVPRVRPRTLSTATGGSTNALLDAAQSWDPGQWRLATVLIVTGTGRGQCRAVVENTADTLTVEPAWRVPPDGTSRYLVAPLSAMTVWHYNYALDSAPVEWQDCVRVLWQKDTIKRAGLARLSGTNRDGEFRPAWFNRIDRVWFAGCSVVLQAVTADPAVVPAPAVFANTVTGGVVEAPTGSPGETESPLGIRLIAPGKTGQGPPALALTCLQQNSIMPAPAGISVGPGVHDSLDDKNIVDVENGAVRLVDRGTGTRQITPALWAGMQGMEPWPGAHFWNYDWGRAADAWPYFPPPRPWPPRWMPVPLPGIGKPARVAE